LIGQFVVITAGCVWLRHWIRGLANRSYEITLDDSRVVVFRKVGDRVTRDERSISDVIDVESEALISLGEGADKRPETVRLHLRVKAGRPIEILCGRPIEAT